jgi:hypothetical protein
MPSGHNGLPAEDRIGSLLSWKEKSSVTQTLLLLCKSITLDRQVDLHGSTKEMTHSRGGRGLGKRGNYKLKSRFMVYTG